MFLFVLRKLNTTIQPLLRYGAFVCECLGLLFISSCGDSRSAPSEQIQVYLCPESAYDVVESAQEIAFHDLQSRLRASWYLDPDEHIFFHDDYVDLPCVQVISTAALSQIADRSRECPSIVVEDAFGFDVVIAYRDGSCLEPPTLIVETISDKHLLIIYTEGDRGICDAIGKYQALGINFN